MVILPDRDKLLRKIKIAIRVAPDTDIEYPEGARDNMYYHYIEDKQHPNRDDRWYPIAEPITPKIVFTSGGLTIEVFKTKKILTELLKRIEKLPITMVTKEELPAKYTIRGNSNHNRQIVGELIKGMPEGIFTDGSMLVKGTPPGRVVWNEERLPLTDSESIVSSILKADTEPVELVYYVVVSKDEIGVSSKPIIQLIDVNDDPKVERDPPYVVFKSDNGFAIYNQYRHNVIKRRYPKATYGMSATGQLIAYMEPSEEDGGLDAVASIMCIKATGDDGGVTSNPYGYDMAVELGLVG